MSVGVFEIDFPRVAAQDNVPRQDTGPAGALDAGPAPRSFLSGEENRLAAVALAAMTSVNIASANATPFNPLTLHGPSGTGKSQLALTLACQYQQRHPKARVLHVCGADFAHEFAVAVERHGMDRFRDGYRQAAMLVLDGLDALAAKPAAQQELLWTIDAILQEEGRVIVVGTAAPADLPMLLPPLRDRLLGGLCVPVAVPGFDARLALLRRYAANKQIPLPEETARFLAERLTVAAPVLCGTLLSWSAAQAGSRQPLDIAAARQYLAQRNAARQTTIRDIALKTSRQFNVTLAAMKGPGRQRRIAIARSVAIFLARRFTDQSLERIGAYFGRRDHTTALHSVRRVQELIESDPQVRTAVTALTNKLGVNNLSVR
ncbi:MAG: DnaA/Hda family protein [Pirellulales bacterium]